MQNAPVGRLLIVDESPFKFDSHGTRVLLSPEDVRDEAFLPIGELVPSRSMSSSATGCGPVTSRPDARRNAEARRAN